MPTPANVSSTLRLLAAVTLAAGAPGAGAQQAEPRPPIELRQPAAAAGLEVRYVANEGFLVEGGGRRVLVDALFGAGVTGYPVAPAELRRDLELGGGEWGGVQVALASHVHPDHFHSGSARRFLEANPEAVLVSTPQARALFENSHPEATGLLSRFRAVLPAAGEVERLEIHGVRIAVLNLHHGERDPPVENLGFVVTLGAERFLHFGDTEAKLGDFEPYLELLADTDLGLLPFWFLSSEWRAEMVRERIRPRWIVVAHLPLPTAPADRFGRWQDYANLVRVIEAAFPDALFPGPPGESLRFGSERAAGE